jgi:hypothetical protein
MNSASISTTITAVDRTNSRGRQKNPSETTDFPRETRYGYTAGRSELAKNELKISYSGFENEYCSVGGV